MKKIYKSPAIEAVEIEINSIMQSASPGGNNSGVGLGGAGIGGGNNEGQEGEYEAGRNRGFGNLWGNN